MSTSAYDRLPTGFPHELMRVADKLGHLGISELAWDSAHIGAVIAFLTDAGYAILGGDVYEKRNGELGLTYDNWYVNRDEGCPWSDFTQASGRKALGYIEAYRHKHGDNFYYSVVFVSESRWEWIS